MRTALLLALLSGTSVLAVPATPVKDRTLYKKDLKQATRRDIVARATRPRSKRATVSGTVIPDSSNMQTFAMRAGGTGDQDVDGTYAQAYTSQPSEQYNYAAFGPSGESTAALYYLDADGYLVRSDNQYAYGGDYTESGGLTYIPFNQSKDRIGTGNGNYFIQCSVAFDSTLSCALANVEPASKSTQLVLCGVNPAELGLADPDRIDETGCSFATISALQASP